MAATENTWKFGTFLWILAGLLIPIWPISLPFCWYMAYRSYKSGSSLADQIVTAQIRATTLAEDPNHWQPRSGKASEVRNETKSRGYDLEKWKILCEVDDEIRAANILISQYGNAAVDEFASKYLKLNDKKYLDSLVSSVVTAHEAAAAPQREGDFWGIRWSRGEDGIVYADLGNGIQGFNTESEFQKAVRDIWRAKNANP